jgi:hypothetical protein
LAFLLTDNDSAGAIDTQAEGCHKDDSEAHDRSAPVEAAMTRDAMTAFYTRMHLCPIALSTAQRDVE